MKVLIPILIGLLVAGCGKKEPKIVPEKLITNPIVEKAVRQSLKKPTGELTQADYEKVTELNLYNLYGNKLTSVKGLENLTNLEELDLQRNQLTDVKGLENLTQLDDLNLNQNNLTDVKGLEKLDQLTWLLLYDNQLTDVKGLEKLTKLEYLGLSDNKLTSVKGLEKLTQLTNLWLDNNPNLTWTQIAELQKALPKCEIHSNPTLTKEESARVIEAAIREDAGKPTGELTEADLEKVTGLGLQNNQLTDVKGLEKLTQLEELHLDESKLTELPTGLEKLTQLERLNLSFNQLTSVTGLEKLTQLTRLALDNNQLTKLPTGLEKLTQLTGLHLSFNQLTEVPKGLENLTQLKVLILDDNPDLTKAQIDELKKALPKCKIFSNPTK